jgi:hypothetical protein
MSDPATALDVLRPLLATLATMGVLVLALTLIGFVASALVSLSRR